MSRGIGWLQKEVLREIEASQQPVLVNKILWTLAEKYKAIHPVSEKIQNIDIEFNVIDSKFSNSFNRSVTRLVKESYLNKQRKRLTDIDELIENYPFRTSRHEIRLARLHILPELKKYVLKNARGRFTGAQTEAHCLGNLKKENRDIFAKLAEEWSDIHDRILKVYLSNRIDELFDILIKGRSLFIDGKTKHTSSLFSLTDELRKLDSDLPEVRDIVDVIDSFYWKSFPEKNISYDYLKSFLYAAMDFGKLQKVRMKKEFKEYLRRNIGEIIIAMPGHKEPGKSNQPMSLLYIETEFSPLLDVMIDRHILPEFIFLSRMS